MRPKLLPISNIKNIIHQVESEVDMPKDSEPQDGQYRLDLQVKGTFEQTSTIVSFVDSATRDIRREAIERVKKSGIFQLPSPIVR
jgi:hypothetical protein